MKEKTSKLAKLVNVRSRGHGLPSIPRAELPRLARIVSKTSNRTTSGISRRRSHHDQPEDPEPCEPNAREEAAWREVRRDAGRRRVDELRSEEHAADHEGAAGPLRQW